MSGTKIVLNGKEIPIGGGGGTNFTTDDTLVMHESNILGVALPTKALTTDEYNALSEEEKMAEVQYIITDDNESSHGSSQEIYSLEEVKIGTWIDGRQLYRKVFETQIPNQVNTRTVVIQVKMDINVKRIYGYFYNVSRYIFPVPVYDNGNYVTFFYDESDRSIYSITNFNTFLGQPMTIIIEYTKTTDQASVQVSDNSLKQEDGPSVKIPEFNTAATSSMS